MWKQEKYTSCQIGQKFVYLLTQVNPLPANPVLHVQRKEPRVFVHWAFVSQGLVRHSLMSIKRSKSNIKNLDSQNFTEWGD